MSGAKLLAFLILFVAESSAFLIRRYAENTVVFSVVTSPKVRTLAHWGRFNCVPGHNCTRDNTIQCTSDRKWNWECEGTLDGPNVINGSKVECEYYDDGATFESNTCWLEFSIRPKTQKELAEEWWRDQLFAMVISTCIVGFFWCQANMQPQPAIVVKKVPVPEIIREIKGKDVPTEDMEKACAICFDNVKNCVVLPCAHMCMCGACATSYAAPTCPVCRGKVESIIRVFSS
jgi:hypothetical protein